MGDNLLASPVCCAEIREGSLLAVFDNPPVNAIGHDVRRAIVDVLEIAKNEGCATVVFCAKGRTFFSGADIREFGQAPQEPDLPATLKAMDASEATLICLMHGTVLGGGLEFALRCDWRLARPDCRLGFPEVNLGLIPGAGGTQLLPRLVSADIAADMVCRADIIGADLALERGLVDHLLSPAESGADAGAEEALALIGEGRIKSGKRRLCDRGIASFDDQALEAVRERIAKRARGQESPLRAFEAVKAALPGDIDEGLASERQIFLECRSSPQSSALRHIFFAEKSSAKIDGQREQAAGPAPLRRCAVIGCGTMGAGIAAALPSACDSIVLVDADPGKLDKARAKILSRLSKMSQRGQISDERRRDVEANLTTAAGVEAAADADLVIEAVFEDLEVKQKVFAALNDVAGPEAILATNTSYIDPRQIFAAVEGPHRCLGLHFFSPADVMKLLEIVALPQTDARTLAAAAALAKKMRKVAVIAQPEFGFAANSSYMAYGRAVQELVLAGNSPESIDRAMTGFGMAMGPLAVLDMSGIDIGHQGRMHNPNPPDDPAFYLPAAVLVERGELGRKSGVGFYRYEQDRPAGPNHDGLAAIAEKARQIGVEPRIRSDEQIVAYVLEALCAECQRLVDSGVCQRPGDMDVIWVNGYGFPRWRGGPMHWRERQQPG